MLDLKYRPLVFENVLGNQGPVLILKKRSIQKSLHQRSILLGGPKGCGKTTLARIVSRAVSCQYLEDGNPCNECDICVSIINGNSLSHRELDAATSGTVENIRSIVDGIDYQNIDGTETVIILDEAHRLSLASQDALLKAMEERLLFVILCTTEPSKIRPALRDRVDEYAIRPPSTEDMIQFCRTVCEKEEIKFEDIAIKMIVENSERSPRMCLNEISSINFQGVISEEYVREYYRYSNKTMVANVLSFLTENISIAATEFNLLAEKESPSYIRDMMISIISNSIRSTLGIPVKESIPKIPINKSQINAWTVLGKHLALLDKPKYADIELVLFSFLKFDESPVLTSVSFTLSERPNSSNIPSKSSESLPVDKINIPVYKGSSDKPALKPSKSLEIDGVIFSSEESLTSVDAKITPGRGSSPVELNKPTVEWDKLKIPMSEQEFANEFIQRIRVG